MQSFRFNNKIKKKREIQTLLKNSYRVKNSCFNIYFLENKFKYDRLGILVSKRIGNAVKRNRTKRISREIFRKEIPRIPPYYDILIQIKPGKNIFNENEYEICLREWINKSKTN